MACMVVYNLVFLPNLFFLLTCSCFQMTLAWFATSTSTSIYFKLQLQLTGVAGTAGSMDNLAEGQRNFTEEYTAKEQ